MIVISSSIISISIRQALSQGRGPGMITITQIIVMSMMIEIRMVIFIIIVIQHKIILTTMIIVIIVIIVILLGMAEGRGQL